MARRLTRGSTPCALFVLLYACEFFGWAMLVAFAPCWRIPATTRPPIRTLPHSVDVLVCTYDEGLDILEATLVGCAGITYPHVTWVLDDGRRELRPCARPSAREPATSRERTTTATPRPATSIMPSERSFPGDLRSACSMPTTCHNPTSWTQPSGTSTTPKVAVVQTPHDFSNHDSFQHFETGRHDQSMFFEVILPGKDIVSNGVFWCGSAAVIRREALIEVGGVATETIAEDFHTTIKMHGSWLEDQVSRRDPRARPRPARSGVALAFSVIRWARGEFRRRSGLPQNPLTAANLSASQRVK